MNIARYSTLVLSLAEHFRSGQLSTEFLATASVEEVSKALIGVRGIGQVSESPCGKSHTHVDVELGIMFDRLLVMMFTLGGV
jgi:DNA-3-methyladenine glycosylase II